MILPVTETLTHSLCRNWKPSPHVELHRPLTQTPSLPTDPHSDQSYPLALSKTSLVRQNGHVLSDPQLSTSMKPLSLRLCSLRSTACSQLDVPEISQTPKKFQVIFCSPRTWINIYSPWLAEHTVSWLRSPSEQGQLFEPIRSSVHLRTRLRRPSPPQLFEHSDQHDQPLHGSKIFINQNRRHIFFIKKSMGSMDPKSSIKQNAVTRW